MTIESQLERGVNELVREGRAGSKRAAVFTVAADLLVKLGAARTSEEAIREMCTRDLELRRLYEGTAKRAEETDIMNIYKAAPKEPGISETWAEILRRTDEIMLDPSFMGVGAVRDKALGRVFADDPELYQRYVKESVEGTLSVQAPREVARKSTPISDRILAGAQAMVKKGAHADLAAAITELLAEDPALYDAYRAEAMG